jgi:hypothetical protein
MKRGAHKNLYENIHSNISHESQKMEIGLG